MIIDVIQRAKVKLIENNISPPYSLHLSPDAHSLFIAEINERDGRKHTRVFEILGMRVEIDARCPPRGAYIMGGESK
jgi:hypothetical protein